MNFDRSQVAISFAVALVFGTGAVARAATPSPHPTIPPPPFPKQKLHADYVVEVNKKGQVVKIKSGHGTKYASFNGQTYGNALQMWIRKQDGTAVVGLFRVSYDYDPTNHHVSRKVALISTGGSWGDQPGAANVMIDTAKKEYAASEAAAKKQQAASHAKLPSLNDITGKSPAPSTPPSPHI
ncbi:MAG TPA: hypothetical protein VGF18_01030 [Candidatus Tumulicola sp.]